MLSRLQNRGDSDHKECQLLRLSKLEQRLAYGLFQFISAPPPPVEKPENSMGGGYFFQMENSMEGGIFGLEIPRRGLKILTKCWKFHGWEVNVRNSMGGWSTCVGNSMEWSKNAVGNSMGGVKKNGVPQKRGGGADINWNSPIPLSLFL